MTSELSGFYMKPIYLRVKPLKAAIQPLPKLPTRMVLLNSRKSRGVHTTPQVGVHPGSVLQPAFEFSGRAIDVDIAVSVAGHVVVAWPVLLDISDKQAAADVLYVKGANPCGMDSSLKASSPK